MLLLPDDDVGRPFAIIVTGRAAAAGAGVVVVAAMPMITGRLPLLL